MLHAIMRRVVGIEDIYEQEYLQEIFGRISFLHSIKRHK